MTMHPNELDLLDHATGQAFPGDAEVAAHVAACRQCAALVRTYAEGESLNLTEEHDVGHHRPASLASALAGAPPTPSAGQLWRAEWDGLVQLMLLMSATDTAVDAVPVIDAEAADDRSVMLDREILGWPTAVLAADVGTLPIRVLDLYLGMVTSAVVDRVQRVADGELGDGDPVVSPLDERWGHRVLIHENLVQLADATWVPPAADTEVLDVLRAAWSSPQLLANDIGVMPGQARAILNGQRPLTDEQRGEVGRILGREIGPAAPEDDVLWAIDHPTIRSSWRERAQREGKVDSPEFRWDTYSNGNFALAARSTGGLSDRELLLAKVKQVLDAGT